MATEPQTTGEIMIALLKSIDASLKVLATAVRAKATKSVATARDLDGRYGNPKVRLKVRDWTGPDMKGRLFSECPAEFLDLLAETFDWLGDKEEREGTTYNDKPTAPYKRQDAARARGWAQRIRSGAHTPPPPPPTSVLGASGLGAEDDTAPFGEDEGFIEETEQDLAI